MFKRVILLTGMPRSGTSWLSQIFDSSPDVCFRLSPLFSYEFKNALNEASTREQWRNMLKCAYKSNNDFMNQTYRRTCGEYPTFANKNPVPRILVIKDTRFHNLTDTMLRLLDNLQVVAIVRHPCGAIHSWLTAPREFPNSANPLEQWRSGACRKTGYGEYWGFDDWKNVTRHHVRLESMFPNRVVIQQYEDLVRDAVSETKKLFGFCDIELGVDTEIFIQRSQREQEASEYAVFKNPMVSSRWMTELQPSIRDTILSELESSDLKRFLK